MKRKFFCRRNRLQKKEQLATININVNNYLCRSFFFFLLTVSTTVCTAEGSASVEMSPKSSEAPVVMTFFRIRLMIFPDRVRGRLDTKCIFSGCANEAISFLITALISTEQQK